MSQRQPELADANVARLIGTLPVIRPLQLGDHVLIDELMRSLQPSTRFRRFHAAMNELPPALLERLSHLDMPGEAAFLATATAAGREIAIGEARYAPSVEDDAAREFAVVVSEPWQRMGLGTALMQTLVRSAARQRAELLYGDTFIDNVAMLGLARQLGFECTRHPDDAALVRTSMRLASQSRWLM